MQIDGLDKIYVLHHKPFRERGELIKRRLTEEGIEWQWVNHFAPEDIVDSYEDYVKNCDKFVPIDIKNQSSSYQNFSRKVSIGSLSLILKHIWCWADQIRNGYETILIIEDDCEIPKDFLTFVRNNVRDHHLLNAEITMLGTAFQMTARTIVPGMSAHLCENQKTRCTHAYLIDIHASEIMLQNFKPINNPIDFKMNEIMEINQMAVAWSEPALKQTDGK